MTNTITPKIPLWIRIVSGLIALLGIFVGISLYASPEAFMPDIDFTATGIHYLAQMWGARQIAIAGIMAFSVVRNSSPMLIVSLLAYSIMNVQDFVIGISKQDYGLAGGASFFFLLPAIMIMVLIQKQKIANRNSIS
jgi:hypothetical protein